MKRRSPPRPSAHATDSRCAPVLRCLVALGFVICFTVVAIGAMSTASDSPALPYFEVCCVVPLVMVVILELRPAVIALWYGPAGNRRAIRRFRRELDSLPEIPHPQGA
jgi:hypothetical protein